MNGSASPECELSVRSLRTGSCGPPQERQINTRISPATWKVKKVGDQRGDLTQCSYHSASGVDHRVERTS